MHSSSSLDDAFKDQPFKVIFKCFSLAVEVVEEVEVEKTVEAVVLAFPSLCPRLRLPPLAQVCCLVPSGLVCAFVNCIGKPK